MRQSIVPRGYIIPRAAAGFGHNNVDRLDESNLGWPGKLLLRCCLAYLSCCGMARRSRVMDGMDGMGGWALFFST